MVESIGTLPTLLPYLDPGPGRFCLRLFLDQREAGTSPAPPFACDDADPLSRVVAARIVTDNGSQVRPVWLRIQRELHGLACGSLQDLTNPQVEECWQQAFAVRRSARGADEPMFLAGQIGTRGELLPFTPLFCCRAKQVFFHPPCPTCGRPLVLCRDDELLAGRGLEPYSTSLRRFLHCPSCMDSGAPFYVSSRSGADEATVHDQRQLILAWGQLGPDAAAATGFPCPRCPGHEACFGRNSLVLENVASFSFYPFFMFIEPAADLDGSDFLALLGGATPQELILRHSRSGRCLAVSQLAALGLHGTNQGFLYPADDPRRFFEVLFLKLTFLEELAGELLSRADRAWYPEISLSLSSVAVQVNSNGLLPFFWNFSLHHRGVGQFLGTSVAFPRRPPLYTLYGLGWLWLAALLVNSDQNMTMLAKLLNQHLQPGSGGERSLGLLPEQHPRVFAPARLFWKGERLELDDQGLGLWNRVLAQGLTLLESAFQGSVLPADGVLQQIAELRQEVRRLLLPADTVPAPVPVQADAAGPARQDRDREIHDILTRIGRRWSAREQAPVSPGAGQEQEGSGPAALAPGGGDRPAVPPARGTGHGVQGDGGIDLEETVLLTPGSRSGQAAAARDQDATLIIGSQQDAPPAAVPGDSPETPGRDRPRPGSLLSRISPARHDNGDDDTLAETIILRPDGRGKRS